MKFKLHDQNWNQIWTYVISGIILICIYFLFRYGSSVAAFFSTINKGLAPFVWGFVIAFICVPLRRVIETKWLAKTSLKPHTKRVIGVVGTMAVFAVVLISFFAILTPQLISSIETLVSSLDTYMNQFEAFLQNLAQNNATVLSIVQKVLETVSNMLQNMLNGTEGILNTVLNYSVSVVTNVINFFIGVIIAVYLLMDSERWKRQLKRVLYAVFNSEAAGGVIYFLRLCQRMLNNFIFGKALDSLIIGIVCGIVCAIMRLPYTPLLAFIVGITNMIPVFGPFIGAIPCIFILLMINPVQALEFTVFILILQQVDGNILGPRILGDQMGLPALWVMFAILIGGQLWGVIGMFLGVPVFSVFYVLIRDFVNRRLREKRMKIDS